MKIFQIVDGFCHWDATAQVESVESAAKLFPNTLLFVEAPDYVFEGWGYLNGSFIKPTPPEGWLYDDRTGTFYREDQSPPPRSFTEAQLLGQQITALHLAQIEQGQFATELQLQIMEGSDNV